MEEGRTCQISSTGQISGTREGMKGGHLGYRGQRRSPPVPVMSLNGEDEQSGVMLLNGEDEQSGSCH